jgi:hypothetical protein
MESLGIGEWIVIGLSVVIGMFFIIGNWINNQRSTEVLRWLRRGLGAFGEVKSSLLSAPTTTGLRLKIDPPEASSLKEIQGNLVLARRENLPMWIYQLVRGKREHLTLSCNVQPVPDGDLHAYHQSNLEDVEKARRGEIANLTLLKQAGEFHFYAQGSVSPELANRLEKLVSQYPGLLLEASLMHKAPHLTLDLRLSQLKNSDPQSFFRAVKNSL